MQKPMLAIAQPHQHGLIQEGLSEPHAISALAALGEPTCLALYRPLSKHEPVNRGNEADPFFRVQKQWGLWSGICLLHKLTQRAVWILR
jgi:hypothetical protein